MKNKTYYLVTGIAGLALGLYLSYVGNKLGIIIIGISLLIGFWGRK